MSASSQDYRVTADYHTSSLAPVDIDDFSHMWLVSCGFDGHQYWCKVISYNT